MQCSRPTDGVGCVFVFVNEQDFRKHSAFTHFKGWAVNENDADDDEDGDDCNNEQMQQTRNGTPLLDCTTIALRRLWPDN